MFLFKMRSGIKDFLQKKRYKIWQNLVKIKISVIEFGEASSCIDAVDFNDVATTGQPVNFTEKAIKVEYKESIFQPWPSIYFYDDSVTMKITPIHYDASVDSVPAKVLFGQKPTYRDKERKLAKDIKQLFVNTVNANKLMLAVVKIKYNSEDELFELFLGSDSNYANVTLTEMGLMNMPIKIGHSFTNCVSLIDITVSKKASKLHSLNI